MEWARSAYRSLGPHLGSTRYINYLAHDDENAARVAYGGNYERLRDVKRTYDPDNVFHINVNIEPR